MWRKKTKQAVHDAALGKSENHALDVTLYVCYNSTRVYVCYLLEDRDVVFEKKLAEKRKRYGATDDDIYQLQLSPRDNLKSHLKCMKGTVTVSIDPKSHRVSYDDVLRWGHVERTFVLSSDNVPQSQSTLSLQLHIVGKLKIRIDIPLKHAARSTPSKPADVTPGNYLIPEEVPSSSTMPYEQEEDGQSKIGNNKNQEYPNSTTTHSVQGRSAHVPCSSGARKKQPQFVRRQRDFNITLLKKPEHVYAICYIMECDKLETTLDNLMQKGYEVVTDEPIRCSSKGPLIMLSLKSGLTDAKKNVDIGKIKPEEAYCVYFKCTSQYEEYYSVIFHVDGSPRHAFEIKCSEAGSQKKTSEDLFHRLDTVSICSADSGMGADAYSIEGSTETQQSDTLPNFYPQIDILYHKEGGNVLVLFSTRAHYGSRNEIIEGSKRAGFKSANTFLLNYPQSDSIEVSLIGNKPVRIQPTSIRMSFDDPVVNHLQTQLFTVTSDTEGPFRMACCVKQTGGNKYILPFDVKSWPDGKGRAQKVFIINTYEENTSSGVPALEFSSQSDLVSSPEGRPFLPKTTPSTSEELELPSKEISPENTAKPESSSTSSDEKSEGPQETSITPGLDTAESFEEILATKLQDTSLTTVTESKVAEEGEALGNSDGETTPKLKTIGPNGGEIDLYGYRVTFPENAINNNTEFQVSIDNNPENFPKKGLPISSILSVTPRMYFNKPVSVNMLTWYSAEKGKKINAQILCKEDEGDWEFEQEVILTEKNEVTFEVWHFSGKIVMDSKATQASDADGVFHFYNDVYMHRATRVLTSVFCKEKKGLSDTAVHFTKEHEKVLAPPAHIIGKYASIFHVEIECRKPEGISYHPANHKQSVGGNARNSALVKVAQALKKENVTHYFEPLNFRSQYEGPFMAKYHVEIEGGLDEEDDFYAILCLAESASSQATGGYNNQATLVTVNAAGASATATQRQPPQS